MVFNRLLLFITFLKDGCKGTVFIWIAQGLGVGLTIFLERQNLSHKGLVESGFISTFVGE